MQSNFMAKNGDAHPKKLKLSGLEENKKAKPEVHLDSPTSTDM